MLNNILRPKFQAQLGLGTIPSLTWILVLGLILRLISLNQSLWLDEATSILVARDFSFTQILAQFSPGDFHPPLYYLMLKVWVLLFGATEVSARMLSVLFGVATVWVVYLITNELAGKITPLHKGVTRGNWGLLSALLLATAPLHIYYSQEARMYVPATFFASLSVLFFLRVLSDKAGRFNWVGLVLTGAILLYTDYLPGFIFIFFAAYLAFFARGHLKKYAKMWVASGVSLLALFLPWIPTLLTQFRGGLAVRTITPEWWKVLGRTNFQQLALVPLKFTIGRIPVDSSYYHVGATTVTSALFAGLFYKAAKQWRETKFLWLWLLIPTASAAILGLWLSVFSYFRLIFVLPAFYLLLAYGVLSIRRQNVRVLAVVGLLAVNLVSSGVYLFNPRFHREDWRGTVSFIEENSQGKKTTAIFVGKGQQEAYDYYSTSVPSFGPEALGLTFDTIWLIRYVQPIFDPEDSVRQEVEARGYTKIRDYDFNGVVVWEYQK